MAWYRVRVTDPAGRASSLAATYRPACLNLSGQLVTENNTSLVGPTPAAQ